jgi:hypothetical protein
MIAALSLEAAAYAWLATVTRPGVAYPVLVPMLVMGAGLPAVRAPIAKVSLNAAGPHEEGPGLRSIDRHTGTGHRARRRRPRPTFATHGGFIPAM